MNLKYKNIPLTKIIADDENIRDAYINFQRSKNETLSTFNEDDYKLEVDLEDQAMNELIDSVKELGVIQPIIVSETTTGVYKVKAGFRRFTAATKAGLETIPCVIVDFKGDAILELTTKLSENIVRKDMTDAQIAYAIKSIFELDSNYDKKDIAKGLGIKPEKINQYISILGNDEYIKALQNGHKLSTVALLATSNISDKSKNEIIKSLNYQNITLTAEKAKEIIEDTFEKEKKETAVKDKENKQVDLTKLDEKISITDIEKMLKPNFNKIVSNVETLFNIKITYTPINFIDKLDIDKLSTKHIINKMNSFFK